MSRRKGSSSNNRGGRPRAHEGVLRLTPQEAREIFGEGDPFLPRRTLDYRTTVRNFYTYPTEQEKERLEGISPAQRFQWAMNQAEASAEANGANIRSLDRAEVERQLREMEKTERGGNETGS